MIQPATVVSAPVLALNGKIVIEYRAYSEGVGILSASSVNRAFAEQAALTFNAKLSNAQRVDRQASNWAHGRPLAS